MALKNVHEYRWNIFILKVLKIEYILKLIPRFYFLFAHTSTLNLYYLV